MKIQLTRAFNTIFDNKVAQQPLSAAFLTIAVFASTASQAQDLQVEIAGISSNEGKIYIQLFKGEDNFKNGVAAAASIVDAKEGQVSVNFNSLSAGEYAVRYFHDEDNDGQFGTNFLGIPTEGYGFSNNAKANFGPPNYSDIKFSVSDENTKIVNRSTVNY